MNSFHVERVEFTNCKEVELNNQTNIVNVYVYVSGKLILNDCNVSNCTLSCKENLEIKKSENPKVCIFEDAILKAKEFMQKRNSNRVKFTNTKIIAHILEIGEYEGKLEFEGKNIIFHSNGYWKLDKFYYPPLVTDLLKTQMKNIFSIYETIPECNVSVKDIFNTCKKHGITLKKPLNTLHVYYKDLEKHVPVWVKIMKEGNWYEMSGKIE